MRSVLALFIAFIGIALAGPVTPGTWDQPSAVYLAQLCAISYCPQSAVQAWSCPNCDQGLSSPNVFVTSDTEALQAFVTDNQADTIFVVFKGTDPLSWASWISDLDFPTTPAPDLCPNCAVHEGFQGDFLDEQDPVLKALQARMANLPNAQIVVTGHSLGAAIAQLFAIHLVNDYNIHPTVYTFGNPRVGNPDFAATYNNLIPQSFRVNNNCDIVPHVPPESFGFEHAGTVVWCTDDTNCDVMWGQENDGGFLHTSILDHGHYLGINYLNYISLGFQSQCLSASAAQAAAPAHTPARSHNPITAMRNYLRGFLPRR